MKKKSKERNRRKRKNKNSPVPLNMNDDSNNEKEIQSITKHKKSPKVKGRKRDDNCKFKPMLLLKNLFVFELLPFFLVLVFLILGTILFNSCGEYTNGKFTIKLSDDVGIANLYPFIKSILMGIAFILSYFFLRKLSKGLLKSNANIEVARELLKALKISFACLAIVAVTYTKSSYIQESNSEENDNVEVNISPGDDLESNEMYTVILPRNEEKGVIVVPQETEVSYKVTACISNIMFRISSNLEYIVALGGLMILPLENYVSSENTEFEEDDSMKSLVKALYFIIVLLVIFIELWVLTLLNL